MRVKSNYEQISELIRKMLCYCGTETFFLDIILFFSLLLQMLPNVKLQMI